jgi:hypothetical protein
MSLINEIVSTIGPLRDLIYTYGYRYNDLSCFKYLYYRESFKFRHIALELGNIQVL